MSQEQILTAFCKLNSAKPWFCTYWCADHDLCPLLQGLGLLPHAAPSVHGHGAQVVGLAKALALRVDLG